MKKTFCGIRILAFLWIATLFFTLFTPLCSAATCAPRKVRVGYFTADQFQETDAAGLRSGYGYDYLQAIAQYANWEYDYVDASWAECLALLENGEIDLVGFMEKSPERERTYDFAAMQSGMDAACLFVPTSDTHYAFEDFPSFDGMTVGVTRGSMHAQTLAAYAAENGFSVTMVPYESEPLLLRALNENKVNSALMNRSVGAEGFRMIAELTSTPFYYATTKGNSALLKELNAAQKQITSSNPYFDSELAARHFSSLSERTAVFTSAERNYITGHAAITALYDPLWFPLEFYNRDTDSYDGVMSDVFRSISASTGLTFEFETADSYHNVLERFQNGEGEILTALSYDYNWAATLNTSLTPSFIEVPAVAVLSSHSTNSTVVAMPRGYYLTEQLKKDNTHGSGFTIHYYDTIPECFDALLHGNAGSTIVNTYVANYFLHFPAYQNFTFRSVPGSTDRLCIGVSKNSDPLLLSIISKAVSNISHAEMQGILGKYTNYSQKITPVDILYSDPALVISGLIVVLIVLFTSVMLFVSNHISHRKNVQLERANAAKTDFLARMSHEMRTPLSAIIGLNNLAQEQISDPEALENSLHQVDISSHHLLQLINDVLDMTKISEGKMVMRLAPFDLLSTVEIVRTVYGPTAEQRQLSFAVDTTNLKQSCVCGDELRLRQVVINLISNALKYNRPGGSILLQLENLPAAPGAVGLRITISDTGIGIREENLERMFDAFEREERSDPGSGGGTGLGLPISMELLRLMGSHLMVKSVLGAGSTFWFDLTLPVADAAQFPGAVSPAKPVFDLSGKRFLVFEDSAVNAMIVRKMLESAGGTADIAANGKLGCDLFAASAPGTYAGILMDIRMPVMNGLEAARHLRALPRADAQTVRIVALSANAFLDDVEKSLASGMDAHLSKPIDRDQLLQAFSADFPSNCARDCPD